MWSMQGFSNDILCKPKHIPKIILVTNKVLFSSLYMTCYMRKCLYKKKIMKS